MGIFMFITFASANLITIGAMWYGLMSQYRYNNGMVLGVHIPPEHAEEPGVTEQVTNVKRKMKRFHIINLILIMALSILCFFNMALYVIIWIVWIFAYIGAAIYFNAAMHRKLYDYKVAQGWLVEGQKKKVYIDTAVLTMTEKSAVKITGLRLRAEVIKSHLIKNPFREQSCWIQCRAIILRKPTAAQQKPMR